MTEKKRDTFANNLRRDILSGRYGYEGGIPDESEMAREAGVARGTVRAALTLLEGEGVIVHIGRTYYVNSMPIVMTQYVPSPGFSQIGASKMSFVHNRGDVEKNRAFPRHLAEKLHIQSSLRAVFCTRIIGEIEDGKEKPTRLSNRYYFLPLSDEKVQRIQDEETYDPAWDTTERLNSHDQVFTRPGTADELEALELPSGTCVLGLYEVIRDQSGQLVMVHETLLSPRHELIFGFEFVNKPEGD